MQASLFSHRVDVPEGVSGKVKIERFEVTPEDAMLSKMRAMFSHGDCGRPVPAGTYTRLSRDNELWMSDTPSEMLDHLEFVHRAKGRVLVHGLGIGAVIDPVLRKPEVEHLTIIEIDPDVISLVAPHYLTRWGDRLEIIEGDAFTWSIPKGARWDVVWHDVWPTLSGDNLPAIFGLMAGSSRRSLGVAPALLDLAIRRAETQPIDLHARPLTVAAK